MHDIQSVGHTWLHTDKTLQVQTVACALLHQWGDKKTLPMPFRSFQSSLILGELLTGGAERFTLCVVASTLMVFKAGNPQVVIQTVIRISSAFLGFFFARRF